jgi:hypothetical protein
MDEGDQMIIFDEGDQGDAHTKATIERAKAIS